LRSLGTKPAFTAISEVAVACDDESRNSKQPFAHGPGPHLKDGFISQMA